MKYQVKIFEDRSPEFIYQVIENGVILFKFQTLPYMKDMFFDIKLKEYLIKSRNNKLKKISTI